MSEQTTDGRGTGSERPARRPRPRTSSRPFWAARLEDAFNRRVGGWLRRSGYRVRIEPYTSYATETKVRILGRAVFTDDPPDRATELEYMRAVRGWRNFIIAVAPHAEVTVEVGGHTHHLTADRAGVIDAIVDTALTPGWHTATLTAETGETVEARIICVGRDTTWGIVSDIDDTVMVTALPRPLLAAWNAFVLNESARRVVPGMPVLYNEVHRDHPDAPVVYLSTGAWNVAPALRRFLAAHQFPAGPLLLTDWGPTNTGIFRSGQQHKMAQLRDLIDAFPHVKWLLIGDDGQHDPTIYGDIAAQFPDHVRLVALRELSPSEHVLSHGVIDPEWAGRFTADDIPLVAGHDGRTLARRMRELGYLDADLDRASADAETSAPREPVALEDLDASDGPEGPDGSDERDEDAAGAAADQGSRSRI